MRGPACEIVLPAVDFVGDNNYVPSVGQRPVPRAPGVGEELPGRGEDHAARFHREPGAQLGPVLRQLRRLAQQVPGARKGAEELVIGVVAVRQYNDGRVRHRRLADDAPGVEGHGQALARARRVPDDPDAPVPGSAACSPAGFVSPAPLEVRRDGLRLRDGPGLGRPRLRGAQCFPDRCAHRVELVIAGHPLDDYAATVVEDDEIADEIEEAPRFEYALDQHLELGQEDRCEFFSTDGAPRLETAASGVKRADQCTKPIRDCQHLVEGEQRRKRFPVRLELPPCGSGIPSFYNMNRIGSKSFLKIERIAF